MRKKFIGVWRLLAFEEIQANGEISYLYGDNPVGMLIYDKSGYMSVQIMQINRTPLSTTNFKEVDAEELKLACEGFTAFFGTYEIDEKNSCIIHKVQGHLLPNSVTKILKRKYEFSGDQLVLKPSENRRVIWEKVTTLSSL